MPKRRVVKRLLPLFVLVIVLLVSILFFNTLRFKSKQIQVEPAKEINLDSDAITRRLSEAVRFKTISTQEDQAAAAEFSSFHEYLKNAFPKTHATLSREVVGDWSLLYTWKGNDETLKPVLLTAHLDVVPAEVTAEASWQHPPFEGNIADGYVWGRGTMDDKSSVLGILEGVELLLTENYQPHRTVYLAFGHDEEVGGKRGAPAIASVLRSRGVELEYVLDEGLFVTEGIIPGITAPVALVGIAEKGFLTLELSIEAEGGHSSVPPQHTSIGILSEAINKLEAHQMPAELSGVGRQMFDYIGPEMPWGKRLVFANLWLFKPLVENQLAASPSTNALIRTTTAVTIVEGGIKENVLPSKARAVVNFRILPGDSIESVIDHVTRTVDDSRVKITRFGSDANEPSGVSDTNSQSFQIVQRTIKQVFPEAQVAPGLVVGATDSKHYQALTKTTYRFLPVRLRSEDISRIHGMNERISIQNYLESVKFYFQLIKNSTS